MKKFAFKGFTLIELLVVIAIIALLASIILASLNTARSKARDATREQSLQEMAKAIALIDTGSPVPLIGCSTTSAGGADASGCTGVSGTAFGTSWSGYKDPSNPTGLCTSGSNTPCKYTISHGPLSSTAQADTEDYEICSYLENQVTIGGTATFMVSVTSNSNTGVIAGCS